jgi:soluble lytic murein transglycosylase-like protein
MRSGVLLAVGLFAGALLAINSQGEIINEVSDDESVGWDEVPFGAEVGDMVKAVGAWVPPRAAAPYLVRIAAAEDRYGLPRNMLARVIHQETRYREDIISGRVKSPVGAAGIGQFMPATAAEYGIDPLNVDQSINAAALYLSKLYKRFGNWKEALAAYNWGQGNVARRGLANAPLETRNYFGQILSDLGLA